MASDPQVPRGETPPPAYQSRPGSLQNYQNPHPAASDSPQSPLDSSNFMRRETSTTSHGDAGPSSDARSDAPSSPSDSTGKRSSSFVKNAIQFYKDKRKAKEATRKVDYYKKLYGFVPKNAMTEAEWRDAKERIPKTKVPFKARGGAAPVGLGGLGGGV